MAAKKNRPEAAGRREPAGKSTIRLDDGESTGRSGETGRDHQMSSVGDRLQRPGQVARLLRQTERLSAISRIVLAYLPAKSLGHVALTTASDRQWILTADSSALATRLRFELPRLQQSLGKHFGKPVPPLSVRIGSALSDSSREPAAAASRQVALSASSGTLLTATARSVADPVLRQALERLAKRARR